MYSVFSYGSMIADRVRTDAYVQALRQAVRPGSVVLDIGTGTGIFAMLACRFGARRVYAIEPDDAISVAREAAAANGFSERIEFIQELSTRVTLPEQANIIISDLRGILPLFQHHLPAIMDARKRLLAPDGILIPRRDSLWAAIAQAPELYKEHAAVWEDDIHNLTLISGRRFAINTWRKGRMKPEQMLTEPECLATLDYKTLDSCDISAELTWTALREGVAHGISIWFDTSLIGGVGFSNAPGSQELIYGSAFFPLAEPVTLSPDDTISVAIRADLVGDDYIWRWDTRVTGRNSPGEVKANFTQSTFFATPLSLAQLRKRASNHAPSLNEDGQIEHFILSLMDGKTSLEETAHRVSDKFPEHFAKWSDALTRVSELSLKFSR
ncbi:MAG TPA: 50S ribosomal protein L11 methyltransferase [Blastocatellia bacterium]|nr:50S ribosomal protein L11 methyltransferase [Blastocatellia bacterium]